LCFSIDALSVTDGVDIGEKEERKVGLGSANLTLTVGSTTMSFQALRKAILSPEQLAYFQTSKTYRDVVSYIESLNNAVVGVKLTDECSESPVRSACIDLHRRRRKSLTGSDCDPRYT